MRSTVPSSKRRNLGEDVSVLIFARMSTQKTDLYANILSRIENRWTSLHHILRNPNPSVSLFYVVGVTQNQERHGSHHIGVTSVRSCHVGVFYLEAEPRQERRTFTVKVRNLGTTRNTLPYAHAPSHPSADRSKLFAFSPSLTQPVCRMIIPAAR